MKSFIEEFTEENADTEYCVYCTNVRQNYFCCGKRNPYLEFKHFAPSTQLEIMKKELENAYH